MQNKTAHQLGYSIENLMAWKSTLWLGIKLLIKSALCQNSNYQVLKSYYKLFMMKCEKQRSDSRAGICSFLHTNACRYTRTYMKT